MLAVSLVFYAMWRPLCSVFLLWIAGVSYAGGLLATKCGKRRQAGLAACLALMLLPLAFYKFIAPADAIVLAALHACGLGLDFNGLNWMIPAGLSIYTLQAVGYVADVARGKVPREQSLLNHALYLSFFPTVLSGPINRSFDLMPQFREHRLGFDKTLAGSGARLVVWGMFLKVAVADRFGIYTSSVFGHAMSHNGFSLLFAQVCYLFQMYCDFAGYSYIAQGCGRLSRCLQWVQASSGTGGTWPCRGGCATMSTFGWAAAGVRNGAPVSTSWSPLWPAVAGTAALCAMWPGAWSTACW